MKVSLCFFCVLWNDFILFQSIFFNRINPLLHVLDRFYSRHVFFWRCKNERYRICLLYTSRMAELRMTTELISIRSTLPGCIRELRKAVTVSAIMCGRVLTAGAG